MKRHLVGVTFAAIAAFLSIAVAAQSVPILSVTFEGNRNIDTSLLRAQMRVSRDGGWYNPENLKIELQNLELFLQSSGFLRAKVGPPDVEIRTVATRGQVAVLRIPIAEGPRYLVGEISIRNAQVFKATTMLQMAPVRAGQPYSRQKIAEWKEKIEDAYHTMGYIRVEINAKEDVHELRHVVDCALELNEGRPYRVGKITVVGDDTVKTADFKRMLLLGEGGLYNPEMVSLSVQFLNTLRLFRPLSESDVEVKIDDANQTVELVFKVVPVRRGPSS